MDKYCIPLIKFGKKIKNTHNATMQNTHWNDVSSSPLFGSIGEFPLTIYILIVLTSKAPTGDLKGGIYQSYSNRLEFTVPF